VKTYLFFRPLAIATLITYIFLRNNSDARWEYDLVLFNLVALLAAASIALSPILDDPLGRYGVIGAIIAWGAGSITSSLNSFFDIKTLLDLDLIAQSFYALFYPLAIFGLTRAIRFKSVSKSLELLDTAIIAIGYTTILTALLVRPAMTSIEGSIFEVFLAILYPVGDIVILVLVLILVLRQRISWRNGLILIGAAMFFLSDFYFLYQSYLGKYEFGSLTDVGWLISFIFISEAFWFASNEVQAPRSFNSAVATIALLGSSTLLAIAVLQPSYIPRFLILPAFVTIALSFLRMGVAINDARNMSNEQILARTDELTGLANRRKFMVDCQEFLKSPGSLLILDLDGFKAVNDNLGHAIGDQLLKQVASRFQRVMPSDALLARLGGDEFGALIPGDDGMEVAKALKATLTYPLHINSKEICLDVSIGEASNEPGSTAAEQLLRRADEAMYEAKRSKLGVLSWHDQLGTSGSRL